MSLLATMTCDVADELRRRVSAASLVRQDEPLARRTTLRVGGPADLWVEPASEADLAAVLRFCAERTVPFFVIGRGSNLLVKDGGWRGAVLCLAHPVFAQVEVRRDRLHCGAGARLKAVAAEAKRASLAGLEFLEGIPGTLGGALRMNAGAMGGVTFAAVESVRLMDHEGGLHEVAPAELEVGYRCCAGLRSRIALGAVLRGQPGDPAEIERRMNEYSRKRWSSQPAAPSAGCLFKNPPSIAAGKLIDELGLKGARVGGARISMEHGNFIANDGSATAADILELMALIRQRAKAERGIDLEPEVQVVGE